MLKPLNWVLFLPLLIQAQSRPKSGPNFEPIKCDIADGNLDQGFDITGPFQVLGICCKGIRSLKSIIKTGTVEKIDFNNLCDQQEPVEPARLAMYEHSTKHEHIAIFEIGA